MIHLTAIKQRLAKKKSKVRRKAKTLAKPVETITILDHVDLNQKLSDKEYKSQLAKYQDQLYKLV